ncbi:MAG: MBL fold metallo-hydrolase [Candidatus Limnocylindrales bacterium]
MTPGPDPVRVGLRWLGHSTVLVELPGLNLLTDPFFRDRLGLLRRHGPVPDPASLPSIDVVLLSHAHPDHFDRSSLRAVRGRPCLVVPAGLGALARRAAPVAEVHELSVGDSVEVGQWVVTAVPARHWRSPAVPGADSIGYLVEGVVVEGVVHLYFAGDTGTFRGMRALDGRVDLALLPIGRWGPQPTPGHLTPASAARVAAMIGATTVLPIHWGTLYPRGLERLLPGPLRRPGVRFRRAMTEIDPSVRVIDLDPGGATTIELPRRAPMA